MFVEIIGANRLGDDVDAGELFAVFNDEGGLIVSEVDRHRDETPLAVILERVGDFRRRLVEEGSEILGKSVSLLVLDEGKVNHRRERGSVRFSRSFSLPCPVDPEKASATVKDGILTVRLEKAPEARPRQITVKAS